MRQWGRACSVAAAWAYANRPPPRGPLRFYYSKSLNCCIEIRLLLGCDPSYQLPCREFVGNCGDTKDQFASLQDSGIPEEYECHQFPDETAFKDKIIVGLICTAVAIPFTYIIGEVFAKSNEPEFPEAQLSWPKKLFTVGFFLKLNERWDWQKTKPWKFRVMTARFAHEGQGKIFFELFNEHFYEPLWGLLCCEKEEESEESESESSSSGSESGSEAGSKEAGSKRGSGKHGSGSHGSSGRRKHSGPKTSGKHTGDYLPAEARPSRVLMRLSFSLDTHPTAKGLCDPEWCNPRR